MGFRALVPHAVERPPLHNFVGTDPDARGNTSPRIPPLRAWQPPRRLLGGPALPGPLHIDAAVPGVWAAGNHRYAHNPVLGSDRLVAGRDVAFTVFRKHSQVWVGVCRC